LEALQRAEDAVVPREAELGADDALDEEGAALARELFFVGVGFSLDW
jgi:hypothetical protein